MSGRPAKSVRIASAATIFAALLLGAASPGYCTPVLGGTTLGGVIQNTVQSSTYIPSLLAGLSYLFGIVLGALGIGKIKEHVDNPINVPIWDALKRLLAGSGFLALPVIIEASWVTLTGSGYGSLTDATDAQGPALSSTPFNGATTGAGLDAMVVALMANIWQPMWMLIGAFSYLAAICFIMVGISRMLKTMQEGPRGPGGIGTIMTFILAGALFSAPAMMGDWSTSLFGTNAVATFPKLAFTTGMTGTEEAHVEAVISAVEAFMMVLGMLSFVRGWFIIRDVAEGDQQASLMAGMTHLFGGALAVNLGPLMNAVQTTFGLDAYGVNFTT